jgi:DNA-directed RNA polymerase specialized sigma24 family protein
MLRFIGPPSRYAARMEEAAMTFQQRSDSSDPAHGSDPVVRLVLHCQQHYRTWAAAPAHQQEACSAEYSELLEQLWFRLADDLRRMARGWIHSHMAPDIESLAMNLFANIVVSLPKLRIDPARNVRNLLLTVARRSQIDEYRRVYSSGLQHQSAAGANPADAHMWQPPGSHTQSEGSLDLQQEVIDPNSTNIEERLILQIDQQSILETVWRDYWPRKLSKIDFLIMELRWRLDPPSSFREIAGRLGAGWTEDTVRQRHFRIISATRDYLRERGLID